MEAAGQRLLGRAKTETGALGRLSAVILPLSAFLNNTPVVAMFMPLTVTWCRRNRISPSRLLMPIAFLATLGGTCTLIGTSTNLVVDGMMKETGIVGLTGRPGIGLFELSLVGMPAAIAGVRPSDDGDSIASPLPMAARTLSVADGFRGGGVDQAG